MIHRILGCIACVCVCVYKYKSLVPGKTSLNLNGVEFALLFRKLGNLRGGFLEIMILVIVMSIKITILIPR